MESETNAVTESSPYPLIEFPEGDVNDYFYGVQAGMVVAHVFPLI
jgi:hypothetical protein